MDHFLYSVKPLAIDLAATLFFYVILATTHSVPLATGLGMALGLGLVAFKLFRGEQVAPMQWTSLALVFVMGGLTLITHDARFVLIKATVIYVAIGATMLEKGWMYRYIPPIAVDHVPRRLVIAFGYVWAVLIFGSGLLNLYLTFTASPQTVAKVMSLWAPGSKITLFLIQFFLMRAIGRRNYFAAASQQGLSGS